MNKIVENALKWEGKEFHPGVQAQCAEWVSTILDESGVQSGQGYKHTAWCPDFEDMGTEVSFSDLQPGDIVLFDNTYQEATFTHVGIYIGNGEMIHRNTMSAPVQRAKLTKDYWDPRFNQGRRFKLAPSVTEYDIQRVKIFSHDGKTTAFIGGKQYPVVSLTMELVTKEKVMEDKKKELDLNALVASINKEKVSLPFLMAAGDIIQSVIALVSSVMAANSDGQWTEEEVISNVVKAVMIAISATHADVSEEEATVIVHGVITMIQVISRMGKK